MYLQICPGLVLSVEKRNARKEIFFSCLHSLSFYVFLGYDCIITTRVRSICENDKNYVGQQSNLKIEYIYHFISMLLGKK